MTYSIGEKIHIIRLIRGYTEIYVAGKLRISQQTYSYLERSSKEISNDRLLLVCEALEITMEFLTVFNPDILLEIRQFKHTNGQLSQNNDRIVELQRVQILQLQENVQGLRSQLKVQNGIIKDLRHLLNKKFSIIKGSGSRQVG